ncbi:MAG: DUF1294 domain-containing protein [Candidatus Syntrophonatronum acetioxidans]|uniref:DUF1294 domain-containing protein n=1 Tax=Candidatus Syntrophonatronum acetioxidans TaxID=1795816 RepID=A0A424YFF4_9FIRM|nr:MAG: DUF1294 domain-containing protein [Candidatus Syntrophonatronum acetioxidans]
MGYDKHVARYSRKRIPEKTLLLLAFLLGAPGILLAMFFFRHKTLHLKFQVGIPLLLILNLLFLLWGPWK